METITQAAPALGLIALLVLILVGRSVGRSRARRAHAAAETETGATPAPGPVEHSEHGVQPEHAAERRGLFRRRRRRSAEVVAAPGAETPAVEAPAVEAPADATADQIELRALREQLRALEQVVQQQVADHPTAALVRVEEAAAEQSAAYLRQVSLVVRGLAAHTSEDENPRRTLARVAAAVERLGVPNEMERPILPMTKELPSRSQHSDSRSPHHLRQVAEPDDGGHPVTAPQRPATDVFAGLHAVAPVEVREPDQQPLDAPTVPAAFAAPAPMAGVTPYADLATAARFEEPLAAVPEADPTAMHELEADGGIPACEVPQEVLPVPPPATPQPSGRRRGRSRKSP